MATEQKWIASELVKTEMLLALRHGAVSPHHYDAIARLSDLIGTHFV